eukprot:464966-Pleurochrysis_carterae.AAC.1
MRCLTCVLAPRSVRTVWSTFVQHECGCRVAQGLSFLLTPLALQVQAFVQTAFNAPCRQGYGLTETCAATCVQVSAAAKL